LRKPLLVLRKSLLVLRESLLVLRESLLVLRESLLVLRKRLLVLRETTVSHKKRLLEGRQWAFQDKELLERHKKRNQAMPRLE
jgi:hypothetical protein